ncbi:RICIN domain-containing protein [Actinoplanes sp. G11-F43]|uniref:RICIN domain-containing protein n=1 Tax=Actinoplanes sp. G11-F43 TaxID=3424130 RepID=UPI003D357DD4
MNNVTRLGALTAVLAMAAAGCDSSTAAPSATASSAAVTAGPEPSTGDTVVDGSDAGAVKPVDVTTLPAAEVPDPAVEYYKLKTVFRGADECLEGNRVAGESVLAGAAFQDKCQDVDGQAWRFTKRDDGYYTLRTKFLGDGKCLEGNQRAGTVLGGAAFLDDCEEVTGQQWKLVEAGDGRYRLQTRFRESEGECLEGNRFAPESVLKGASFMDECQNVTGQLWYFTAIPA